MTKVNAPIFEGEIEVSEKKFQYFVVFCHLRAISFQNESIKQ